MGPPISIWPYSQPPNYSDSYDSDSSRSAFNKCNFLRAVDGFRVLCLHFTVALVFLQIVLGLSSVAAGPVVLNLDYLQGPVPLARNIRHLPCISRRTGQEGLCMFAIDCLKANGSHLGTCIDRFYFGSCCQIPDKTILPQIIGNNIEDNTIDGASFVHPQTEDKFSAVSKKPGIEKFTKKPETSQTIKDQNETIDPETKIDDLTTIDNKIPLEDVKLTTAISIESSSKIERTTPKIPVVTEVPIKLSTFQTVSGDTSNSVTEKQTTIETTSTTTPRPTKLPTKRPTYKPRPSYKPSNFTRPQYTHTTTLRPRPTRPVALYNTTRKPPYKPTKPTKKPLPSPPRLNITILPQSTSSRPVFTRPLTPVITYINATSSTVDVSSTTTSVPFSSSSSTTTQLTTTTSSTTIKTTTTTEKVIETTETPTTFVTEPPTEKSTEKVVPTTQSTVTASETTQTEVSNETTLSDEAKTEKYTEIVTEKDTEVTTENNVESLTEKSETLTTIAETAPHTIPTTSAPSLTTTSTTEAPTTKLTTDFPPLVTWSNTVSVTKAPEKPTTTTEEIWSPITPPEGWVLISTIPPKPDTPSTSSSSTTSTTTTTTTTTTESPEPETTIVTTEKEKEEPTTLEATTEEATATTSPIITTVATFASTEPSPVSSSTISSTSTTILPTTSSSEAPLLEFTVNVTLSPTMPTSTPSVGLSTFTSIDNVTAANVTEAPMSSNATEATTVVSEQSSSTTPNTTVSTTEMTIATTTEEFNMSNYKEVCGRRLWPQARIVGGSKSGFGMWPWQISLRQYRTSTYLHKCGAALLNENWAITAAHCVEHVPPSELLVRLGEHDLANEDEPYGFAERRVQIVASHPHFDPATFEYDLALLRFYEPVIFQPNILPVCVPDDDDDYVGKTAHVTGWGRLFDEGPLPSVLQEVEVPVINNTACEAMYQAAGYNEHIPNIFICAGWRKGGSDSCEGDSGGPMVIQRDRDKRFVLGGVISWGIGCAEPNQPGVYTRISEFRDWINQILQF